jgi:hypothetical protein
MHFDKGFEVEAIGPDPFRTVVKREAECCFKVA